MKTNLLAKFIAIAGLTTATCFAQQPVVEPAPYQQQMSGQTANYLQQGQTTNNWTDANASYDSWGQGNAGQCSSEACESSGRRTLFGGCLSRIQRSEQCFDGFISPITNPFYNEDPRALTEIRPVFVTHRIPGGLGGGTVNVYAAQLRARLSENVSLIAVKDGYFTSTSPIMEDGWADLGLGLKFNLIRDQVNQRLISAGATFEAASGSSQALQGLGSGNLNLFFSQARRFGGSWNHMSSAGVRLPMDGDEGSTSTWVSQHLSRPLTERLFALTELNWFRYTGDGTAGIPGIEALDVANLGSSGVDGNDIVTWAAGAKIRTGSRNELGAAYEIPISGRRDIFGSRVTAHWAVRY